MQLVPRTMMAALAGIMIITGCPAVTHGDTVDTDKTAGATRLDSAMVGAAAPARTLTPVQWDALNLGRAVDVWLHGDLRQAAELLEMIDISGTSSFERADRAAFLLAVTYLRLQDIDAFHRVADKAASETGSPYRRWIRYGQLMYGAASSAKSESAIRPPADLPGAEILAATLLIESGRSQDAVDLLETAPRGSLASIQLYLQALARESTGGDPKKDWEALAKRKPTNHLEADLVATALLRLATQRMETGVDPRDLLESVPDESRHAARALHILGLFAIETGDTEKGAKILGRLLEEYPMYEASREAELAIGALAIDRADWAAASEYFESAEADWLYEYESLAHLENDDVQNGIWHAWDQRKLWRKEIRLAPEALLADLGKLAAASLNLTREPSLAPSKHMDEAFWPVMDKNVERASWERTDVLARHYPQQEEWHALRTLRQQHRRAASALARQEHEVAKQQQQLSRRLDYLSRGQDRAQASADALAGAAARLDNILTQLNAAVSQLEAVRDSALLDIATRTRDMTENIRRELLFMRAVRHFHVEGPSRERAEKFPAGVPSPAELLSREETLATEAAEFLALFAAHYPAVIARSFDEIWEPRLTGESRHLHEALLAELMRARRIGTALDSTVAWYADDPDLKMALSRRDALSAEVDSLRRSEQALRGQIARAVAERGRLRLEREREAIDYHLADVSYELAVEKATDPETAENTAVVAPLRKHTIARLDTFLTRYPESIARGEGRFRLADMRLMQARDDFQIKMAEFLGEDPSADDLENRALAPFVDYAPAITLYESILREDPEFPHVDAVLFNLGMILSDDGQPSGATHLARLVTEYPDSPNCQEAWLRMGSDRFDRKDFSGCISLFEEAIAGEDPSFTAIALYKLGWAHFEEDHFRNSADAFRRLMDLYAAHDDVAKAMDLRDEAEEYLVHSLARSGGADAFREYFDGLGGRSYESQILISLGHLMRSVSLYDESVACDELWLARYPTHAKVPAVAERLVDTYRSWNKPDLAREAKLAMAGRFLPGSAWYEANSDKALRDAGQEFARGAYREAAAHYHLQARKDNSTENWQSALANYEQYLQQWPGTAESHRMHFLAGEAAGRLNGYPRALHHFELAAKSDTLSLAVEAGWQQVAVTDTWYRSTRTADSENGTDSLAIALLNTGRDFIGRYPDDTRCADIVWRQGNIAYAHGWYDQAAASLMVLGERYPTDKRAPLAIRMSGDAHYRRGAFDAAGGAYEKALSLAQTAGQDSIVAALKPTIPLCFYKHAESFVAADSVRGVEEAAPLFARIAQRWPEFKYTDLALYRAGLGFAQGQSYADAAAAWDQLLIKHPDSEYARDAAIQVALVHEKSGNTQSAARAYERFSRLHTDDPDAPAALLKAVDLLAEKDAAGAEEMRNLFLERFPGEVETAMEFRSERAEKELAKVTAGASTLAALLAVSSAAKSGEAAASTSELDAYLALAAKHPELASPAILAQVDYLKAEETYPAYASLRLTQPLPSSIEKKKKKLEALLAAYEKCTRHGLAEYSRASAYRIGQILIEFGDALVESERPAGLSDDDMIAYDEVLEEQSWDFYDRGEDVWSELLRQIGDAPEDPGQWITRTRESLWPRLAQRFLYQPEVEYPLVAAKPPPESKSD